jgi:Tfp pilus assembly protein PilX
MRIPPISANKGGFVLVHVLVVGAIVAVIAAGLLRMTTMNYVLTRREITGAQNRKESEALLSRAMSFWNASGSVCSPVPGFVCAPAVVFPPPGLCNCTCTAPSGAVIRVQGGGAPPCNSFTITSSDPP